MLQNSDSTMCHRQVALTNMKQPSNLYCSLPDDKDRIVITHWRLLCHKLYIETGRHKRPKVIREENAKYVTSKKMKIMHYMHAVLISIYNQDTNNYFKNIIA